MRKTFLLAAIACVAAAGAALAGDVTVGDLTISDAWTRAMPPGARAGTGFMIIKNAGAEADRLVGGSSPAAGRVEIHEMSVADNIMRMRQLEHGLEVPAKGAVELKPGGYHVMFIDVKTAFKEGEAVPVTLNFEKAGAVTFDLPAMPIGAGAHMHMNMPGMGMHGMGGMGMGMGGMGKGAN